MLHRRNQIINTRKHAWLAWLPRHLSRAVNVITHTDQDSGDTWRMVRLTVIQDNRPIELLLPPKDAARLGKALLSSADAARGQVIKHGDGLVPSHEHHLED